MFSHSCYVEVNLLVLFIVLIDDGTDGSLKIKIDSIIQLEVSQRVHNPTLYTNSLHLDSVFA